MNKKYLNALRGRFEALRAEVSFLESFIKSWESEEYEDIGDVMSTPIMPCLECMKNKKRKGGIHMIPCPIHDK